MFKGTGSHMLTRRLPGALPVWYRRLATMRRLNRMEARKGGDAVGSVRDSRAK
jgi:hypothetical protein